MKADLSDLYYIIIDEGEPEEPHYLKFVAKESLLSFQLVEMMQSHKKGQVACSRQERLLCRLSPSNST